MPQRLVIAFVLAASTCLGCTTRLVSYRGIAPFAAASTFCDRAGRIRSLIDAEIFTVRPDGSVGSSQPLAPMLAHEAVHRKQMEALRPAPGVCPRDPTWFELVDAEVEAYCVEYGVWLQLGADPGILSRGFSQSFRTQFRDVFGENVQQMVASRWASKCPGYSLVWDAP